MDLSIYKKKILIACSMIEDEINAAFDHFGIQGIEIWWQERGHHNDPDKLREVIQSEIRRAEDAVADLIMLGYGLCGNGAVGWHTEKATLVMPRFDDCVNMMLCTGKRDRRNYLKAGHMYLTGGWSKDEGALLDMFESYLAKYGKRKADKLMKMGKLEEVGGPGYIVDLSSRVVTSANIEYHANVVAEKFLARQMIHYVSVIGKKTFDETYDIKDVVQEAESTLFELSQKNMKKEYSVLCPIVDKAIDMVKLAHSNQGGITGISSGINALDDVTCGWQNSDLVIIAARPAMGKTAFALSLAKNIAGNQKIPVAFFSLEMSDVQLTNRLISNACMIEGQKLLSGQLDRADWLRLDKKLDILKEAPLYIERCRGSCRNMRYIHMSRGARSLRKESLFLTLVRLYQM